AVEHVLSLTGDPPRLIPAETRRVAADGDRPTGGGRVTSMKLKVPEHPDVFEAYNRSVTLADVVAWHEARGHRVTLREQGRVEFTRSGKNGTAQSFNVKVLDGVPVTYNFSTNAALPANRGLSPSQVRCLYEAGGLSTDVMRGFAAVLRH